MGITLRIIFLLLFASVLLINCKSKKREVDPDSSEYSYLYSHHRDMEKMLTKEVWIADFKKEVYYRLLKLGYKNDPKLLSVLFDDVDISHYDPYYGIVYLPSLINVDKYLKQEYEDIIQDSIVTSKGFTPQPGKRVLNKTLDFYTSKLLDSLAKEEYKKWRKLPQSKRDSIYGLIAG
ncbi:MAG: hypothetical protein LBE37_02760 [Sphingobacterium sp.]|jgi:hypothetical protein|nr:hypothetical protein [Sphingobacterium sp.]